MTSDYHVVTQAPRFGHLVCKKRECFTQPYEWFRFKEGFDTNVVHHLIGDQVFHSILDPFAGSGSTLIAAREMGIPCTGIEVNPFLCDLIKLKFTTLNEMELNRINMQTRVMLGRLDDGVCSDPPDLSMFSKAFGDGEKEILRATAFISELDGLENLFFKVALGCCLEQVSFTKKDGNGLKYPKNKRPLLLREVLPAMLSRMRDDMRRNKKHASILVNGDARVSASYGDVRASVAIFSPPYANCFDYSEVYKLELWSLGYVGSIGAMKRLRDSSLSSHFNKRLDNVACEEASKHVDAVPWESTWAKSRGRLMLHNYFNDMGHVFDNVKRVVDGPVYCIVGNSAYGGVVIPTDIILSEMLEKRGFQVREILAARKLGTSPQQARKIKDNDSLRESIIVANT